MRIESFQFHDRTTGWQLEETKLDAFNLLVGVSGVGKTKILGALRGVQGIALGASPSMSADWSIRFEEEGHTYRWSAKTDNENRFAFEEIVKDDSFVLVKRNKDAFTFEGHDLPALNRSSGAITLVVEEPSIVPLHRAFMKLYFSDTDRAFHFYLKEEDLVALTSEQWTLEKVKGATFQPAMVRAYLLQEYVPEAWQSVMRLFTDVFPTVDGVRINKVAWLDERLRLFPVMHEKGSQAEISEFSSGMRKTLVHLIETYLAPRGTVILIDDFENSLGKNCLPELVDFILSRAPDLQFIITSHHPYVINNLPVSTWKLVQRRGSVVRVIPARDIPVLQKASRHEAFDRLLNLPEYEDGIA